MAVGTFVVRPIALAIHGPLKICTARQHERGDKHELLREEIIARAWDGHRLSVCALAISLTDTARVPSRSILQHREQEAKWGGVDPSTIPPQKFRQLGDVRRDAPGLVAGEQLAAAYSLIELGCSIM